MARRKKKQRHEEHIDESWLVPYADILTLLLALFIVLFASSSVDAVRFQQLSNVFNQVFTSGTGFMDFPSDSPSNEPTSPEQRTGAEDLEKLGKNEQEELTEVQERVNAYIEKNDLTDKLGTDLTDEGMLISIRENVLFESGVAEVRSENRKIAKGISELLVMDLPRNIIVSGHTDNIPIKNSKYESNWDLSVMRSVNFMKLLLENKDLDPEMLSAKGHGEFKPVASNETKKGRAKNRRVEILIVPRTAINE
ncbi:flagellar motor protein MotB [Peribacillus castrilensis]|uniref:Chemotaxis protein MotB n=1 Tax=Peribacillus simplex TaxID=1478 RepID=A0AAN2TR87_9BACI|nr:MULTISPECIES: flagellar motor protein MotB [Bacillaceae]MCP1094169.1 flagellar motor protein MotB [Bacillaceae bacterium OS4b]MBD8589926.1 flagellar motor protein MotB [Peribacillus simplex]MCF7620743.1 flagellar motor protein MotB [Peribacillus frigoritolerans]MCP1151402.1 flagellar motor protein MotB [Peribacillus frigoritolerans]MCT1387986.1 flagellar motor protein MotB [Peribacillus frigoritolerans]